MEKHSEKNRCSRGIPSIEAMPREQQLRFCAFSSRFGIPFFTIKGRIDRFGFREWEIVGLDNLVRGFDYTYTGSAKDYTPPPGRKLEMARYLEEYGMSCKTYYNRMCTHNLKKWECIGMNELAKRFIEEENGCIQ